MCYNKKKINVMEIIQIFIDILSAGLLRVIGLVLAVIVMWFVIGVMIKAPVYEYMNVILERRAVQLTQVKKNGDKERAVSDIVGLNADVRIHIKDRTYEINRNGKWVPLGQDQVNEIESQIAEGIENPIIQD